MNLLISKHCDTLFSMAELLNMMRKAMEASGQSRYRISKETGIAEWASTDAIELWGDCMDGPETMPPAGCDCPDRDLDGDVDVADFASFQADYGR